jgi:hypothetical protein
MKENTINCDEMTQYKPKQKDQDEMKLQKAKQNKMK